MSSHQHLDDFLNSITPWITTAQTRASDSAEPALLETIEELQVTVEELRISHEQLHQAQTELEEAHRVRECSQADFEQLFEAAPVTMLVTDPDGVVRTANAAAAAMVGVRASSLTGKPLAVFVAEGDRRGFRLALTALRRELGARTLPLRLQPRNGPVVETTATVVPLPRPGGGRTLLWSVHPAQAGPGAHAPASAEELETLRAVLRSLPAAVAVMDLDGTVLAWNPAAERLLGWSEDEVAGRANPALPEEGLQRDPDGRVSWIRVTAAHRDGHAVEAEVVLAPLAGPGGEQRGTVAVIAGGRDAHDDDDADEVSARDETAGRAREPLAPERVLPDCGGDFLERLRAGIAAGLHLG
ncbi:MAG TPA: PAS domain S-box protein, partial [Longimicrobium sp.]|nr:PAS domain S-box protein [Longimicrobium sp.]